MKKRTRVPVADL